MSYKVKDIAAYIVNRSIEKEKYVSNLKLQKLLYYVQAYFAVNNNTPCFNEDFEHWRHGPVIPEVYSEYKVYFNDDITDYKEHEQIKQKDKMAIAKVVDSYSDYNAWDMVRKTHSELPWVNTDKNDIIEWKEISDYFNKNRDKVLGV
ncbi:Panacea domain-containing protein [Clostridium paraputrificum]|uniref:Panacea domain-containing protein n=1 Tax=Clostridium paraputrificum TaxID=29363 RepID=UPI0018A8947D|nr:type II toxin-antitoxin system antitoxin SocA domain-containing protein [Clostridium paraputrificum]MDB2099997.1 DUF4065 domain-containing protein [Clostridium paraputrificum]